MVSPALEEARAQELVRGGGEGPRRGYRRFDPAPKLRRGRAPRGRIRPPEAGDRRDAHPNRDPGGEATEVEDLGRRSGGEEPCGTPYIPRPRVPDAGEPRPPNGIERTGMVRSAPGAANRESQVSIVGSHDPRRGPRSSRPSRPRNIRTRARPGGSAPFRGASNDRSATPRSGSIGASPRCRNCPRRRSCCTSNRRRG